MTQLESARMGKITRSMRQVALQEGVSPEEICEKVAGGVVVIPSFGIFSALAPGRRRLSTAISGHGCPYGTTYVRFAVVAPRCRVGPFDPRAQATA